MDEIPVERACANCGTPLEGAYCSHCGQRAAHLRPTLHELLHEASHELLHFDGKILRTLGLLLFRPGQLTQEFLEGKRARSITPIRIYLLASVLFFGLVALSPPRNLKIAVSKGDAQLMKAAARMNNDPTILAQALTSAFPKAMFVLMPLFGLLVYAFYWRRERLYVPHFYFAVHFHAFAFVMLAIFDAMGLLHWGPLRIVRAAVLLAPFPYLAVALRRVYGGGRLITLLKTIAIVMIDFILVAVTMALIAYITLRRMA
jgi:hypothetical protein